MIVEIWCPRCNGQGRKPHWTPEGGQCYRCKGTRIVQVNTTKWEAVLKRLRAEYIRLRDAVRAGNQEALAHLNECVANGRRLRADLEAAKARMEQA